MTSGTGIDPRAELEGAGRTSFRRTSFWMSMLLTLVSSSGFIVLAAGRSYTFDGDGDGALLLAGMMVASIPPMMFLLCGITAFWGRWAAREKALRAQTQWPVIRSGCKTEVLVSELQRTGDQRRTLPWGLTLTANHAGVALWSGGKTHKVEVWLLWAAIRDIQPAVARNGFDRQPGVGLLAELEGKTVRFSVPIIGRFPFGTFPATGAQVVALVLQLRSMWASPPS